ncbi:hypothetical protein [Saccharospirillum alexandrii]|uniref:hypothetical protein n=1 Tax=Saccharospirillum alexandrii TaxID=2448477 RepID=UPI000FDCD3C4|nr:hypothetical protein [Saccharospirillum alexandrii]
MSDSTNKPGGCCSRGGARPGCGRKPGIKTRPVRLPVWLLDALEQQGDVRHAIIRACQNEYGIEPPTHCTEPSVCSTPEKADD